jgi:hypothetical protein
MGENYLGSRARRSEASKLWVVFSQMKGTTFKVNTVQLSITTKISGGCAGCGQWW